MTDKEPCRLYLITPPRIDPAAFRDVLAQALDAGDVACLQIRLKEATDDEIRHATDILCPVAQERGVAVLMNNRPDLAAELGCDGVHLGQDDMTYREARRIVGEGATVGVTCGNSRHLAMTAAEQGADYVAFGAFFPSVTKQSGTRAELEILSWWSEIFEIPCVAAGGVMVDNCRPLVEAGADFLAVASGVWDYADGPAAAVRAFNEAIAEGG
jgi:thiamine-phosphate pyrophosphorylase